MKVGIFLLGVFMGVFMTVLFYSTLPMHYDCSGYWKYAEKQQGKIVIVIGYNPSAESVAATYGTGSCNTPGSYWSELVVYSFQDRESAMQMRKDVLKLSEEIIHKKRYK